MNLQLWFQFTGRVAPFDCLGAVLFSSSRISHYEPVSAPNSRNLTEIIVNA